MTKNLSNHIYAALIFQFIAETPDARIDNDCTVSMVANAATFLDQIQKSCPEVIAGLEEFRNTDGTLTPFAQSLCMTKLNATPNGSNINFNRVFGRSNPGYNVAALLAAGRALQGQFEEAHITQISSGVRTDLLRLQETIGYLLSCPTVDNVHQNKNAITEQENDVQPTETVIDAEPVQAEDEKVIVADADGNAAIVETAEEVVS